MYTLSNFKTKKALKEAVACGEHVMIFQPGPLRKDTIELVPRNAQLSVEGPHYPEPHKWYASITIKDGKITKVK